jgi:hypothetical protein
MEHRQISGFATEAYLSRLEYEALAKSPPPAVVKRVLEYLAFIPNAKAKGLGTLAKIAAKTMGGGTTSGSGLEEVCTAVLLDLSAHEDRLDSFNQQLTDVLDWMRSHGAPLTEQAARASEGTADPGKRKRIARLLISGARAWQSEDDVEREITVQQVAEFTRISTILLDVDVLVLRAIYEEQASIVRRYRELMREDQANAEQPQLQDGWAHAVFQAWKRTKLCEPTRRVRFLDVLSALPRLESQGLITRPTTPGCSNPRHRKYSIWIDGPRRTIR